MNEGEDHAQRDDRHDEKMKGRIEAGVIGEGLRLLFGHWDSPLRGNVQVWQSTGNAGLLQVRRRLISRAKNARENVGPCFVTISISSEGLYVKRRPDLFCCRRSVFWAQARYRHGARKKMAPARTQRRTATIDAGAS